MLMFTGSVSKSQSGGGNWEGARRQGKALRGFPFPRAVNA